MEPKNISVAGIANAGQIQLVIGLGNPEDQYQDTRHNIGENLVKLLIKDLNLPEPSSIGETQTLLSGTASSIRYGFTKTYMNESGIALSLISKYLKMPSNNILVIHDEVDLDLGKARFKFGGGSAGHNGLKDIKLHLKTNDFWRLRIGVGKPLFGEDRGPLAGQVDKERIKDFVLEKPTATENEKIQTCLDLIVKHWHLVAEAKMDQAIKVIHSNC